VVDQLTISTFKSMIHQALTDVKARANEFSALDAICGDGDHGTAMSEALTGIDEAAFNGSEFKQMLGDMAMAAMSRSCGSTSTLIGSFFMGMGMIAEGSSLDVKQVRSMFRSGLNSVQMNTKARPGDKTLMDALVPAVEALDQADTDLKSMFEAAADAATAGANKTINMKAAFGRAKNYGDRSIGSADPGASSWACMFEAFSKAV
jgi:dihydroxyacetone kinase-like protein